MTFVNDSASTKGKVFSLGMAVHIVCEKCGSHLGVKGYPRGSTYMSDIDDSIAGSIPDKGRSDSYGNFMEMRLAVAPCKSCIEAETGPARELKDALLRITGGARS